MTDKERRNGSRNVSHINYSKNEVGAIIHSPRSPPPNERFRKRVWDKQEWDYSDDNDDEIRTPFKEV